MHMVLLSRSYPLPSDGSIRVLLLQDTDTLRKTWEVVITTRTKTGNIVGITSRVKTRSEAMRMVRNRLARYAATA